MKPTQARVIIQTVVLGVLLAGIAAWYFLQEVPSRQTRSQAGKFSLLSGVTGSDILGIAGEFREILSNGTTNRWATAMQNTADGWKLLYPIHDDGDPDAFHRLETDLPLLKSETNFSGLTPSQIDGLGFKDPSSHFRITLKTGKTIDILNGGMATTENYYYTLVDSNTNRIYLIYAYKFSSLERNVNDLRDRSIFTLPAAKVSVFSVENAGKIYRFIRDTNGNDPAWNLTSPEARKVKALAVRARIMETVATSAAFFADYRRDPSRFGLMGLTRPEWVVTLVSEDGQTNRLSIGSLSVDGYRYAWSPAKEGLIMLPEAEITNRFSIRLQDFPPENNR